MAKCQAANSAESRGLDFIKIGRGVDRFNVDPFGRLPNQLLRTASLSSRLAAVCQSASDEDPLNEAFLDNFFGAEGFAANLRTGRFAAPRKVFVLAVFLVFPGILEPPRLPAVC